MRERIIAAGAPGSGKTYNWLTIARMLPDVTFHVLDPDDGVLRLLYSEFSDVKNLITISPLLGLETLRTMKLEKQEELVTLLKTYDLKQKRRLDYC